MRGEKNILLSIGDSLVPKTWFLPIPTNPYVEWRHIQRIVSMPFTAIVFLCLYLTKSLSSFSFFVVPNLIFISERIVFYFPLSFLPVIMRCSFCLSGVVCLFLAVSIFYFHDETNENKKKHQHVRFFRKNSPSVSANVHAKPTRGWRE